MIFNTVPVVPGLLKQCARSGLKTAIATSCGKNEADNVVDRFGLRPYVHAVSTSCQAGRPKPAPDIFLLAADMLGVQPGACIVIGDSACGLQAAKAAGMAAIGLRHQERPVDLSLADRIVDSLGEVDVDILKTMV